MWCVCSFSISFFLHTFCRQYQQNAKFRFTLFFFGIRSRLLVDFFRVSYFITTDASIHLSESNSISFTISNKFFSINLSIKKREKPLKVYDQTHVTFSQPKHNLLVSRGHWNFIFIVRSSILIHIISSCVFYISFVVSCLVSYINVWFILQWLYKWDSECCAV